MRTLIPTLLLLASCAAPAPAPAPTPPTEKSVSAYDHPITLNLQRASIQNAFDLIARLSGLNIVLNRDVGSGFVTMSVNNLRAGEVVEAVAATFGLKVTRLEPPHTVRVSKP